MRNKYKIIDDYVIIYIVTRESGTLECFVDLIDFNNIILKNCHLRWEARFSETANTFYVQARPWNYGKRENYIQMHRLILGIIKEDWRDIVGDHLDHNGLNNRRYNLVKTTKQKNHYNTRRQNPRNTSGHRGVSFDKERGNWIAQVQINRKCVSKRFFHKKDAIEAARKMLEEAKKII